MKFNTKKAVQFVGCIALSGVAVFLTHVAIAAQQWSAPVACTNDLTHCYCNGTDIGTAACSNAHIQNPDGYISKGSFAATSTVDVQGEVTCSGTNYYTTVTHSSSPPAYGVRFCPTGGANVATSARCIATNVNCDY